MDYMSRFFLTILAQALPVLIGLLQWKKVDTGARVIVLIAGIAFITEWIALFYAFRGNNIGVYNVSSLFFMIAVCYYFHVTIPVCKKYLIGPLSATLTLIVWLETMLRLGTIRTLNAAFTNYECVLTITLSILLIVRIIERSHKLITRQPHFWFVCLFLFSWAGSFVQWGLYEYISDKHSSHAAVLDLSILILNITQNIGFAIVLLVFPRLENESV